MCGWGMVRGHKKSVGLNVETPKNGNKLQYVHKVITSTY